MEPTHGSNKSKVFWFFFSKKNRFLTVFPTKEPIRYFNDAATSRAARSPVSTAAFK